MFLETVPHVFQDILSTNLATVSFYLLTVQELFKTMSVQNATLDSTSTQQANAKFSLWTVQSQTLRAIVLCAKLDFTSTHSEIVKLFLQIVSLLTWMGSVSLVSPDLILIFQQETVLLSRLSVSASTHWETAHNVNLDGTLTPTLIVLCYLLIALLRTPLDSVLSVTEDMSKMDRVAADYCLLDVPPQTEMEHVPLVSLDMPLMAQETVFSFK